jgi:hypothetical protein
MIFLLVGLYLWAGLTVLTACRLFEAIGMEVERLTTATFPVAFKGNASAQIAIVLLWPAVLPLWAVKSMDAS